MKKIIGRSKSTRAEEKFYTLASDHASRRGCNNVDFKNPSETIYTRLQACPNMVHCQTFAQWRFQILTSKINRMFAQRSFKRPKLVLYFIPIGPFPAFIHSYRHKSMKTSLFELVREFLRVFFSGCEVRTLTECDISEFSATSRHHQLTQKLQYYVSDILTVLQKKLPPDGFAIIGLTWQDLYPSANLNFVLGQGSYQHSACLSSFGRFDPNYVKGFKGKKDGVSPEEMKDIEEINGDVLWKLIKVISHETCHVLGVAHCDVFECLMNASSSTEEALSQPLFLCPLCMSKIQNLKSAMCPDAEPENLAVKGHFSGLLQFLQSAFGPDVGEVQSNDGGRAKLTIFWLKRILSYLDDGWNPS